MKFYALLSTGANAKTTAKRFLTELIERSAAAGQLDYTSAADFINESMLAIGLTSAITVEQLRANNHRHTNDSEDNYEWPEEWRIYNFNYNAIRFTKYERFLVSLCEVTSQLTKDHIEKLKDGHVSADMLWPVEWTLQLLVVWYCASRHLRQLECTGEAQSRFEEPFARISHYILLGMHQLRKRYGTLFPLLHDICDRFYRFSLPGLFYEQTHDCIILGTLFMFEKGFILFHQHSTDTLNFFYEAFSVQGKTKTYICLYNRLSYMLQYYETDAEHQSTPSQLSILTNFLVSQPMLEVYYTHLRTKNTKRMSFALFEFLDILQSHTVSLDCFTQKFMEEILEVVIINPFEEVRFNAATLYIDMMKRRLSNALILQHIMDYYLRNQKNPQLLKQYVFAFWQHFNYMRSTTPYLNIILADSTRNIMRYFTARMLITIFEFMQQDFAHYGCEIAYILRETPQILQELRCTTTYCILVRIFATVNYELLAQFVPSHGVILQQFEEFAAASFVEHDNESHLNFQALWILFQTYYHCLSFTLHWESLETVVLHIYGKYDSAEEALTNQNNEPTLELLQAYSVSLQKLHIILKTEHTVMDNLNRIYHTLKSRLIQQKRIGQYANRLKQQMDVNAIEILTACIVKFARCAIEAQDREHQYELCEEALKLLRYLYSQLRYNDETELIAQPLERVATIINSIISLYCTFASRGSLYVLQLETKPYNILINAINFVIFGNVEQPQNTMNTKEFQRYMLLQFACLHSMPHLIIPGNEVWKLCIHYGQPTHMFNVELKILLRTISVHKSEIYKHILPVIVYNLNKRDSRQTLKDSAILAALRAHQRLFEDASMRIEAPAVLRVHVVLVVLQMIEKFLSVTSPQLEQNRLLALKHIHTFVAPLNLSDNNFLSDILNQAQAFRNYALTATEAMELTTFLRNYQQPASPMRAE